VNEDKRAEEEAIAAIDGVQPQSERMLEAHSAQNAAGEVLSVFTPSTSLQTKVNQFVD
jgi:hypothetical protein